MNPIIKVLLFFVVLLTWYEASAQGIFDLPSSIQYVHHLIEIGEYRGADKELKRIESIFGKSDTTSYLRLYSKEKAGKSSLLKAEVIQYIHDTIDYPQTNAYAIKISFNKDWPELIDSLMLGKKFSISDSNWIAFFYRAYLMDAEKARNVLIHLDTQQLTCVYPEQYLLQIRCYRAKRPLLGAGLSAFVPGLGKAYAKQPQNGLMSFFTVGTFGFQAMSGFSLKGTQSIYGWIYAGVASVFYLGNVYGSYYAVKRYNNYQIQLIRNEVKAGVNCYFNR